MESVVHHKTLGNFNKYLDPEYINTARETIIPRLWQLFEQGKYTPPICASVPHSIAMLERKIEKIFKLVLVGMIQI